MTDIEDLVEAVFDIEEIVEEVADPEDLIEDFVANPLMVLFAFVAALAGLLLLVLVGITLVLLVLAFGPVEVLALLVVVCFLVFVGSVAAFVYVRTDIPSDVYRKINDALAQADDSPEKAGRMTETEAIEAIKTQYAAGNLDEYELEQALDEVLTSEDPGSAVERYTENDQDGDRG